MLEKATDDDSQILGHLLNVARKVAAKENLEKGTPEKQDSSCTHNEKKIFYRNEFIIL